jgi:hypothetical protein
MGIDPLTGKLRPIQLDFDKLKHLPRKGAGKVKEAGFVVREVLEKPIAVFRGLKRDTDEPRLGAGWLCYVGRPGCCFEDDGRSVPPPQNRVFLVFVTDQWIAYNWYWHSADIHEPDLPEGYGDRFQEKLL